MNGEELFKSLRDAMEPFEWDTGHASIVEISYDLASELRHYLASSRP